MKKVFKLFSLKKISPFSTEKLLFSDILSIKTMPEIPVKTTTFLDLTLKSEKNLISTFMQNPEILKPLSFSEKMLIFSKLSQKAYSLELIESLMLDLLQEKEDLVIKLDIFLENTRSIDLTTLFPIEFLTKISIKFHQILISETNTEVNHKWKLLEELSHCKTLILYKNLFDKKIIIFFENSLSNFTLEQMQILTRIFGKTNQNNESNNFLNEFIHSKSFLIKLEELLFKQWDSYMDIIKILNNYYNEFVLSPTFLYSILEFLFAELDGMPKNHRFILKHLTYFLNKYKYKLDVSMKPIPKKEILLKLLENEPSLIDYELVLGIFSKFLRSELSSIQKLLAGINEVLESQKVEMISEKISMLHLISKLSYDPDIKKNKWAKERCFLIISKILKTLQNIGSDTINNIEEKDLLLFYSALPKLDNLKKNIIIKPILEHFFEKTLFFMRKDKFPFLILENILIGYSENEIKDKFFYVILEEKLMESLDDMINSINHLDFINIKKAFRSVGFGSRKFYNFLESVLADNSTENIKNSWKFYKKREARYIDFKEKKRKSFKYANDKKEKFE